MTMKLKLVYMSDEDIDRSGSFVLNSTYNLHDPRFGGDCQVCKPKKCPGHSAILNLRIYTLHPTYESDVKKVVNNTCLSCGDTLPLAKKIIKKCDKCGTIRRTNVDLFSMDLDDVRNSLLRLGINEYKFILSKILVPPTGIRPSNNVAWPNDLSRAYSDMVGVVKTGKTSTLQYRTSIFRMYKKIVGIIFTMMSGKEGIFRSIMMGKRINMSARSVIVGDPYIGVDEILVPKIITGNMHIKERCHMYNESRLKNMASDGMVYYPDTDTVMSSDDIVVGQIYERSLMDGDMVMFNRQPSLSMASLMTFKVKTRKDNILAIAMNPIVTPSFNADFDGDEMNVWGGFDIMAKAEMLAISDVKLHDTIHPVQDVITGAYEITDPKIMVRVSVYMDAIVAVDCDIPMDFDMHKIKYVNGWDMIRLSIPPMVDISDLLQSRADKNILCSVIPQRIKKVHQGPTSQTKVSKFYEKLQRVVLLWFSSVGFNIKLSDCKWNKEDIDDISRIIANVRTDHSYDLDRARMGERAFRICDNNYKHTSIYSMIKSGGKGDIEKMSQVMCALGHQHEPGNSDDVYGSTLLERGFISSSFYSGLSPAEYSKHSRTARSGLMGTGTGTSKSGQEHRKLALVTSDMILDYDGNLMDGNKIISFG